MRLEATLVHRSDDRGEGFSLGFVKGVLMRELLAFGVERGDVEGGRRFFEADEAALHERAKRGVRNPALGEAVAELAKKLASAKAGELSHDGELVVVELG